MINLFIHSKHVLRILFYKKLRLYKNKAYDYQDSLQNSRKNQLNQHDHTYVVILFVFFAFL